MRWRFWQRPDPVGHDWPHEDPREDQFVSYMDNPEDDWSEVGDPTARRQAAFDRGEPFCDPVFGTEYPPIVVPEPVEKSVLEVERERLEEQLIEAVLVEYRDELLRELRIHHGCLLHDPQGGARACRACVHRTDSIMIPVARKMMETAIDLMLGVVLPPDDGYIRRALQAVADRQGG